MSEKYRVTDGRIHHQDGVYEEGDEFEATESTLRAFGDRLEPVDGDDDGDGDIESEVDTGPTTGEASVDHGAEHDTAAEETVDTDEEPLAEGQADVQNTGPAQAQGDLKYDNLTVNEIKDVLDERDFSDEELREMRDYEEENKNRSGALDAIESQIDEQADDDSDGDGDGDGDGR